MVCSPGFANCDGEASDGCEVDLESDPTNCGACGVSCDGRACLEGACASPPDAGPPPMDSGSPQLDASVPPRDAGSASIAEGGTSD
jgi:hypothetical protein